MNQKLNITRLIFLSVITTLLVVGFTSKPQVSNATEKTDLVEVNIKMYTPHGMK